MKKNNTLALVEAALMIAMSTVLGTVSYTHLAVLLYIKKQKKSRGSSPAEQI